MLATAPLAPTRPVRAEASVLVPVEEAVRRVTELAAPVAEVERVPVGRSRGRILAVPVASPHALPRFDNSAMDGYALGGAFAVAGPYRIVGTARAGHPFPGSLKPGEAVRIMTGAEIPRGADAVLREEDAELCEGALRCRRVPVPGADIRRSGEDLAASETVLFAGTLLDARHAALLAALGLAEAPVRRSVRVAILSTGSELVAPGAAPFRGGAFDANRALLAASLDRPGIALRDHGVLPDHPAILSAGLLDASRQADLVITSGGISGSEEDHVAAAVAAAGGALECMALALKPGRPLGFGRIGGSLLIALPGNPLAALAAFVLVGRPLLARLLGHAPPPLRPIPAIADFARPADPRRAEFLPVRAAFGDPGAPPLVRPAGAAGAARLLPLVGADGVCLLPPRAHGIVPGEAVGYLPFADLGIS
ncbi:MAG: molybdopterin molybdotransferase MoeA [Bauldia sp.]|nr:molybdopterin molybdotransferase MoeA [Bauldia sp.]